MKVHRDEERAVRRVALAFGVSTLGGVSLAVVYILGGHVQAEGVLLALALGGLGFGLAEWAGELMPPGPEVGDYADPPPLGGEEEVVQAVEEGWESFGRRKFLFRMLGAAAGAMGLALVFPIRSLGPSPGSSLLRTAWRRGSRMVREDGRPVRATDLAVDGVLTVFPEGRVDQADSQTVLIRLDSESMSRLTGRKDWTADDGLIAYSKICTHAGCPVGLYRVATHDLFCPCHQSTFDVLDGARPVAGPATRALPQLPIEVDDEGYVVARDDFSEPVGPAFWSMDR